MKNFTGLFFKISMLLKLLLLSNSSCSQDTAYNKASDIKNCNITFTQIENNFNKIRTHKLFSVKENDFYAQSFIKTGDLINKSSLNSLYCDNGLFQNSVFHLRRNTEEKVKENTDHFWAYSTHNMSRIYLLNKHYML